MKQFIFRKVSGETVVKMMFSTGVFVHFAEKSIK